MRNDVIVEKLIAYTDKILSYCNGLDYDSFSTDSKLGEACVFNLSQMGELANRVGFRSSPSRRALASAVWTPQSNRS